MRPIQRIRDVAEAQWGLFTLAQAKGAGIGWRSVARMADAGLIERVAHGVYRVRGGPEPDHQGLRAAWLQLDPARPAWERLDDPDVAVISHSSAASLYGLGDLRADVHEFTLPKRRQTRRPDVRLHGGQVPKSRRILVGGLPTTGAAWMIGDLAADNVDPEAVARITTEVLDRVLAYPWDLAEALAPSAQRFGLRKGDGLAVLNYLLERVQYRGRLDVVAEARRSE
jgi:hypothetical protein